MKRYHHDSPVTWPLLEDPDNGDWVRFEDAQAEIDQRQAGWTQCQGLLRQYVDAAASLRDERDTLRTQMQNKLALLRAFLQAQIIQCKSPIPCQSCEALQTLLDATA